MAVRTAANRVILIVWSRVRDDVGLTNQVCALKTDQEFKKSRGAVRLPFQSTFKDQLHGPVRSFVKSSRPILLGDRLCMFGYG